MKNKRLEKLADTYTLQKITQAAGYTQADKEASNKPKTIMNSRLRIKNKLTKNNVTKTPINKKKTCLQSYGKNFGVKMFH